MLEFARLAARARRMLTRGGDEFAWGAAHELAGRGPRLILIGGELRRLSQTMVGPLTRCLLEELHLDKAFMGTIGLTLKDGLTTTDPGEAYTKELVMNRARQVILLADSSKAGKVAFAQAGRWERVHAVVDGPAVRQKSAQKNLRCAETKVVRA